MTKTDGEYTKAMGSINTEKTFKLIIALAVHRIVVSSSRF